MVAPALPAALPEALLWIPGSLAEAGELTVSGRNTKGTLAPLLALKTPADGSANQNAAFLFASSYTTETFSYMKIPKRELSFGQHWCRRFRWK